MAAEKNYAKDLCLAGRIMQTAISKIQDKNINRSHKNIIDKRVGNVRWLGEIIKFDELYNIARKS